MTHCIGCTKAYSRTHAPLGATATHFSFAAAFFLTAISFSKAAFFAACTRRSRHGPAARGAAPSGSPSPSRVSIFFWTPNRGSKVRNG
jgi:hypothetical protein